MSSIYKRKKQDGNHVFYINLTINGQRIRKFAGYTRRVAVDKLKELEYDYTFNHKLNQASLIHIDCDLYDSTVSVLDFIYYLIVPGTIIVFGDWYIHDRQEGPEAAEQLGYKKALNESILKSKLRDYYDSDSMKAFIVVE